MKRCELTARVVAVAPIRPNTRIPQILMSSSFASYGLPGGVHGPFLFLLRSPSSSPPPIFQKFSNFGYLIQQSSLFADCKCSGNPATMVGVFSPSFLLFKSRKIGLFTNCIAFTPPLNTTLSRFSMEMELETEGHRTPDSGNPISNL